MNCRICGREYSTEVTKSAPPAAYRDLCYACHAGIVEGGDKIYNIIFSLLERIEKLERRSAPIESSMKGKASFCICRDGFGANLSCPVHKSR